MQTGYLRFGDLPKGNSEHIDGYEENGISVFEVRQVGVVWEVNTHAPLNWAFEAYLAEGRPAYLVNGVEKDIGGDGEPLLDPESVEIISQIEVEKLVPVDFQN